MKEPHEKGAANHPDLESCAIGPGFQTADRQKNMPVGLIRCDRIAVHHDAGDTPLAEIERQRVGGNALQFKLKLFASTEPLGKGFQLNAEAIPDVAEQSGPLLRETL